MAMGKKQFIAIAARIKAQRDHADACKARDGVFHIDLLVDDLCEVFKAENPAFDRARFLGACGR